MEDSNFSFLLIILILIGVIFLTGLAVYLSFGPPSKELEEPWDRQED